MDYGEVTDFKKVPAEWLDMPTTAKAADELKLKKYFTGKKCKKGNHFSPCYQSKGMGKGCVTCNSIRSKEKTRLKNEALGITPYTLDDFIREADEVHDGYYSYELIKAFKNKTDYYLINCPVKEHEPFSQKGSKHLAGQGCNPCKLKSAGAKRVLPIKVFKERCMMRYKERYDLSRISYRKLHDQIEVGCKVPGHGFFETEANNFMRGKSGCQLCAAIANGLRCRKTNEEFINEAKRIHKKKYDYSLVSYKDTKTNVLITCPKEDHGIFPQLPSVHLGGGGCPKCANETTAEKLSLKLDEFLRRAKEKHGDKYDYSKVVLSKKSPSHTPVEIVCSVHGHFPQAPIVHFKSGCRKCHMEYLWNEVRPIGKEEWIKRSNEQHSNKYSYELVKDFSKVTKSIVTIICPVQDHGEFKQLARDHMDGRGCQKCGDINRGRDSYKTFKSDIIWASTPTEFYFVEVDNSFLKFGISVDFDDRSRSRYTECYYRIEVKRAVAWTIEQYMLLTTIWAQPGYLPDSLKEWGGNTELRTKELPVPELCNGLDELVVLVEEQGWDVFFNQHILVNDKISSLPLNHQIRLEQ